MNKDFIYVKDDAGHRVCKICGQNVDIDSHLAECPGKLIDSVTYQIKIYGRNCSRGCCGYTDTSVEGSSLDDLCMEAVSAGSSCVSPTYTAHVIYELEDINPQLEKAVASLNAKAEEREAKEKASSLARRKAKDLERLELERSDLTADAYARRKAAIESQV